MLLAIFSTVIEVMKQFYGFVLSYYYLEAVNSKTLVLKDKWTMKCWE